MYKPKEIIRGRYEIIKQIGSGGMSEVYLAYDKVLEIEIAIKILLKTEDVHISRFRREAEIIETLEHDNIVKIYDFNKTQDGNHYIVMEYINGMTIKDHIRKNGVFSPKETQEVILEVLNALGYAHSEGVIHRDIKSHNIMITKDKKVKIMDFGIAKMLTSDSNLTNDGMVLGTTYYIAPEFLTKGAPTEASDIYSLGIVMYEMLVGDVPFKGDTFEIICMKHLKNPIPSVIDRNKNVPQSIENVVILATAKKQKNRFKNTEEMSDRLEIAMNAENLNEDKVELLNDIDENFEETVIYDASGSYNIGNANKKIKHQKSKRKKNIIIISSIVAILVVIIGFLFYKSNNLVMPDLSGLPESEAVLALEGLEITNIQIELIPSDEIEEGSVVKTEPASGMPVAKDTEVIIYISSGLESIEIANYVGQFYQTAVKALEDLGFEVEIVTEESSQEKDTVVSQSPAAGSIAKPGEDKITLSVSTGEKTIKMPNFIGLNAEEAVTFGEENNISVQKSYKCNDTTAKGKIYAQSPEYGTAIKSGDKISISISDGACQ